jgi:hypothetical protein
MHNQFSSKTIQQIVAFLGDGKLKDNSVCSSELRHFLSQQSSAKLAEYVRQCLEDKFDKSGLVLQDVVNEIGRRLGFNVQHGRYQGVVNEIGFDGLWEAGNNRIVVEVKTTDAYRINLDTINGYLRKLEEQKASGSEPSSLVVVGRQDTGDLEAQVRGSRHAWSTRLISADALVRLMFINEDVDDAALVERIRKVLVPFEYTRVDNIVDLLFEAQQEVEQKAQTVSNLGGDVDAKVNETESGWQFTPRAQLEAKRSSVIYTFFALKSLAPEMATPSKYSDGKGNLAVVCSISKRYKNPNRPYWYALHPQWLDFLRSSREGYFLLGCMDSNEAYALPLSALDAHLNELNTTEKEDRSYWHIELTFDNDGQLSLSLSKARKKLSLREYSFKLR